MGKRGVFFFVGFLVLSCGQPGNKPSTELGGSAKRAKASVLFFALLNEASSQAQLGSLAQAWQALLPRDQARLEIQLHIVPGAQKPTQAQAEQLRDALGLKATVSVDADSKTVEQYLGKEAILPAAVVLDRNQQPVKTLSFHPDLAKSALEFARSTLPPIHVTLAVFAAMWCTPCKHDLPEIQRLLSALPPEQRESIEFRMYVVTGANANAQPTQADADHYRDALHLDALAYPDEWRWKNFRKYVGGSPQLPAGAVLNAEGEVLKAFRAGATTFVPRDIVGYAAKVLP